MRKLEEETGPTAGGVTVAVTVWYALAPSGSGEELRRARVDVGARTEGGSVSESEQDGRPKPTGTYFSVAIPVSKSTHKPLAHSPVPNPNLSLPFEPVFLRSLAAVTCMRSMIQASGASGLRISRTGSSWNNVCSGVYRWSF